MLFRQFIVFAALAAASCGAKKAEQRDDAAPVASAIRLLDASSNAVGELRIGTEGCGWADQDDAGAITRAPGATTMTVSTTTIAALTDGPNGRALTDHTGARVARVVADESSDGRISALDSQGVALFRIRPNDDRATLYDKASRPAATVSPRDDLLVAKARDDTITHYITGSSDAVLAALLTAPELDLRYRLLLACDRLLGSNNDS
jgi:hypothetical protein